LASSFLVTAGGILTTQTVYLGGICVLYLVLAKQKWWKLLRLDALIGAALLLIIDIAWLATNISTIRKGDGVVQIMTYLIIIVNVSLCLVAAGVVGVAIYTAYKLKTRTYLAVGNVRETARF
jgi:4-amino-4-deoxy-L-arabinose transferase-like glycosyltransferase